MIGHIYLYGIFGSFPGIPEGRPIITLMDVISQIQKTKEATELIVHIDSEGGLCDLGYKVAELLESEGKPTTTIIEGQCASIATVPQLVGQVRLARRGLVGPMIHNPWTELRGDANQLEIAAGEIRAEEDKLINYYASKTGLSKESLSALMHEETSIDLERAVEFGFLTGIIEQQKAVALINEKDIMSESVNKLTDKISKGFNEIMAMLEPKKEPKKIVALSVTLGDGTIATVMPGDGIEDGLAEVGDMMTLADGSPADGSFIMPDGSTITAVQGKITGIVPAAPAGDPGIDAAKAALEKENEELKAKVALLEASAAEIEPKLVEIEKQNTLIMAALKNTSSSYKPPVATAVFAKAEDAKDEKLDPFKEAKRLKEEAKKNN